MLPTNVRHRALATIFAVVAMVTGSLLAAAPADAASSCYATGCTGKDPDAMGCAADAKTVDEFTYVTFTRVELRASKKCHAVWTRATNKSNSPETVCNDTWVSIRGYKSDDTYKGQNWVQIVCGPGTRWTKMWTYSDFVRSCVHRMWYNTKPAACTARH